MKKGSFEQSFKKLEEIVRKLENGNITLEESVKLFDEGIKLNRECNTKLDEAEKKIEILTKNMEGNIATKPFDEEENGEEEEVPF